MTKQNVNIILMPEFNLSQIHSIATNKQALNPVKYINSVEYKALLAQKIDKTSFITELFLHTSSNSIYTNSKWLYIAYISHCLNNNHEVVA